MFWTFLYVTRCSMTNRLRRRVKRLREPRYLIGLIVGAAYMYLMVFRRGVRGPRGTASVAMPAQLTGLIQLLGSVGLLITAAIAWAVPGAGKPITFTRPEVQFFFAAPVTRRELLHYKLLRSQVGILISSAIVTLVMRPATLASGWMFVVGLWVVLAAVRLHLIGVALSRSGLAQHGRSALRRQWLPLAVVLGAVGIVAATVIRDWPTLSAMPDFGTVFPELERLGRTGAAAVVLWPFRALIRLPLSPSTAVFFANFPAAFAIVALNYAWVLRADAAFEEASAEQAERQVRNPRAQRPVARGAGSAPFRLAPEGRAETAILWKNLILLGRYASMRTLIAVLPILILFGIAAQADGSRGITRVIATMALPLAAMVVLVGPQAMRNDLRQDLAQLALLKTWPVEGATMIRGQVLAPAVVVTAIAWLLLTVGALFGGGLKAGSAEQALLLSDRVSYLVAAAMLVLPLVLSQTIVQNGLAVMFPAWVAIGSSRSRGIDAMGQRLLLMAANLLALLLAALPGAIVGGAVAFAVYAVTGAIPIVFPALVAAVVVLAECWAATELLGRVLDRTDVSAVDAAE
jgi:ABC-2 type transport system permease protein